jgi:Ricin-type beta-trefoil lectin domain-like
VAVGLLTGSERKRADTTALYLVLDRHSGGSTGSGNVITQSPSGNGQELEWNIVSAGNGYFSFGNRVSGMVLDMNGGVGAQGGFAVQEPQNSSSFTQQWQIIPVY